MTTEKPLSWQDVGCQLLYCHVQAAKSEVGDDSDAVKEEAERILAEQARRQQSQQQDQQQEQAQPSDQAAKV